MSAQTPKINLISVLHEIILPTPFYSFLEDFFGLDGHMTSEDFWALSKGKRKQKQLKAEIASITQHLQNDPINEELLVIKGILIETANNLVSLNTEDELIALVQERYGLDKLDNRHIGIVRIIFYLLQFEPIRIKNCHTIWKLIDGKFDGAILEFLHDSVWEILDSKPEPVEFGVLRRRIATEKHVGLPDAALLRFVLSIDPRIETLEGKDAVQISFFALKAKQMPYRILQESGQEEISWHEILEQIETRFESKGQKPPSKNTINAARTKKEWYVEGNNGWGLVGHGIKEKENLPDLLKRWFKQTNKPAKRKEMAEYLQPLRKDLSRMSILNMLDDYDDIIQVEYSQPELNPSGKEKLFYHRDVRPLPDGVRKPRKSTKSTSPASSPNEESKLPMLFISYAHADNRKSKRLNWLNEFRRHLNIYDKKSLEIWDDTNGQTN